MMFFRLPYFYCILSAVLLACPFLNSNLWFFPWLGLVPLFFALQDKRPHVAFLLSYFTGIIFFAGIIYWIMHVTLVGLILLVFYLALYFGVFGVIISRIKDRYISIFIIPVWWVILEYLRSHLLSGFGWALLGYSQYKNPPIIQIADITGVYGVSFLVIMTNVLIYRLLKARRVYSLQFTVYSLIMIVVLSYGFYKLNQSNANTNQDIRVSVVQGNIPQEFKWDANYIASIIDKYFTLTKNAAKDNSGLIIWPEASFSELLEIEGTQEINNINFSSLQDVVRDIKTPLLVGAVVLENGNYFNTALLISKEGKLLKRYNKLHLVPFGEYIPLKELLGFLETIVPIGNFTRGKDYTVFKILDNKARFSVLICFEDVFPELSRQFSREGADFLVNITNDAWFGKTVAPYQHLSASVFRAIENRRPVVRCANTGVSGFIDARGRLDLLSNSNKENIFIQGVKARAICIQNILSFYTRFGDVFVLVCMLIVFVDIIKRQK